MYQQLGKNETSPEIHMSLPESWIDRIFERMSCTYGSKFADMWAGTNLEQVKSVWGEKLGGFTDRPEIIKHALNSLDESPWPPTLPEFLNMCRDQARRIGTSTKKLEPPQLSVEERLERAKMLESASVKLKGYDYKAWCKELKRRYMNGDDLLPIQISMASEAMNEVWDKRECHPKVSA